MGRTDHEVATGARPRQHPPWRPMSAPADVDAYVAAQPEPVRVVLDRMARL